MQAQQKLESERLTEENDGLGQKFNEQKLDQQMKLAAKYKMRYTRLQKKMMSGAIQSTPSPRSKARKLLKCLSGQPSKLDKVKRTLDFHYSILRDLKNRLAQSKDEKERQVIARFFTGSLVVMKYKLRNLAMGTTSLSQRGLYGSRYHQQCHNRVMNSAKKKEAHDDFLRDDISRMTTGIKNTVTRNQVKKQRRVLLDTIKNIHRKVLSEKDYCLAYSFFCKQRPFWVCPPKPLDHLTCLCKTHENFQFLVDKLFALKWIPSNNVEEIVEAVTCRPKEMSNDSKECSYGQCPNCKGKQYPIMGQPNDEKVTYPQWCLKKVDYEKDGEKSVSSITVKETIESSELELVNSFQESLPKIKKHVFNIKWQYKIYREIRQNLSPSECLIHIDFSENYNCKYAEEIQSVHFGGSHQQASLHTGVMYVLKDGVQQVVPFCTISTNRQHDPPGIWAHLDPILQLLKGEYPTVKILHFFSDGPATQYKQKGNFYMLSNETFRRGFDLVNWNFFEAGHGKGAPDGIGGAIKRTADRLVSHGKDIPDAKTLYDELLANETKIKLFFVESKSVERYTDALSALSIQTVKGTMKFHQVLSLSPNKIKCRDVSCICQHSQGTFSCPCFDLKDVDLVVEGQYVLADDPVVEDQEITSPDHADELEVPPACPGWNGIQPFNASMHIDGLYLLVRFVLNNGNSHFFIGQGVGVSQGVSASSNGICEVQFMRPYKTTTNTFVWPDVFDQHMTDFQQIIGVVEDPVVLRRGQLKFNVDSREWK
jgi:hypothetical protein